MTTTDREAPHHDTLTCYTDYGCRRRECADRYRAWHRSRDAAKRAGQWQPHVDAEPVRQHLLMLADHSITIHRAAAMAGVGMSSLHPLFPSRNGRRRPARHTVRAEIAKKVLAVTPETATPGRIDPAGTARRIQALVADGWPMRHLGRHFGLGDTYTHQIVQRASVGHLVHTGTALAVADGYERLKDQQPSECGVGQRVINMARNYASSRQWPPTSYWADRMDDIDDPHFEPMYGVTRRLIVAQDANWIMRTVGLDRGATAERLGVSRAYIDHAFRDHPEYAVEVAA